MREVLRGYADYLFDIALSRGTLTQMQQDLAEFARALVEFDQLRVALADSDLPLSARTGIVEELLSEGATRESVRLSVFVAKVERPAEISSAVEALAVLAEEWQERREEPLFFRTASRERILGFIRALFEDVGTVERLDEVEDEIFRFARIVESTSELRLVLSNRDLPVQVRQGIVCELLEGRATAETVKLICYLLGNSHPRQVVATLDWLVERVAAERGRRVARVRSAVELEDDQRTRLADALSRLVNAPVEMEVVVDPSLIGGFTAVAGDLVVDTTVRHRLNQLRDEIRSSLATRDS